MNKHQRYNSQLSRNLLQEMKDISEVYSLGLIGSIEYINQVCIISQAIKADISLPHENWAIIKTENNYVVCDLFESALEAANELNKWSDKNEFKIDKI